MSRNANDIYTAIKTVLPLDPCWVVLHSSLIHFTFEKENMKWNILRAIKKLANEGYTLAFPSFTFSFTETGEFDESINSSETGIMADWVYQLNNSIRTKHPIYSHVIIGPEASEALDASVKSCFGTASIYSIFEKKDAFLVMFGCGWSRCTSFHYFEELNHVPYRYFKKFYYYHDKKQYSEMFVRDRSKGPLNDFSPAVDKLRNDKLLRAQVFNGGLIESSRFADFARVCQTFLKTDNCAFIKNSEFVKNRINDEAEAKKLNINVGIYGSSNLDLLVNKFKELAKDLIKGCEVTYFSSEYGQMHLDLATNKLAKLSLDFTFLPDRLEDIYQVSTIDLIDLNNLEPLNRYLEFINQISKITSRKVFVHEFFINSEQINGAVYLDNLRDVTDFLKNANLLLNREIKQHSNVCLVSPEIMLNGFSNNDPRLWYLGRIPFPETVSKKIGHTYCSFVNNELGKTARLIILDLDNTLWGGVVGEDGAKGIRVGGDFPGNAYKDFQATILKLKERGLALAIVSKNDEDLALKVLNEHPEILIKETDLAAHRINWFEKYQNIIDICNDLSLGLGSVLFVDDNPIEREKVKLNLPQVNVLELPNDPALYRKSLLEHVSLGVCNFSPEDLKRSDSYIKLKEFKKIKKSFKSIDDFYKNLKVEVFVNKINDGNFSRALQLISKTNQFNTTTLRYTDKEIIEFSHSSDKLIRIVGYKDKMSDFENIGLFSLRTEGKTLYIENFLLSCRILERGVEQAALSWISRYAKSQSLDMLAGEIIKTPRNTPAQNFYKKNKFVFDDDALIWKRNVNLQITPPDWVELTEEG